MKKIFITTLCMLFVGLVYGQENNQRYEHCYFQVNKGFSEGASMTDFVLTKDDMNKELQSESRELFFNKDIVFDVKFITNDDGIIMRIYHLNELSSDDLKEIFSQIAGGIDYTILPSRVYKFEYGSKE